MRALLFCWLCLVLLFIVAGSLLPKVYHAPEFSRKRLEKLVAIREAFLRFQEDNDSMWPEHLSDLFPKYIGASNVDVFFLQPIASDVDVNRTKTAIDTVGMFYYAQSRIEETRVVLYEKPSSWNDDSGKWPTGHRAVLTSDFRAWLASREEVERLGIPYLHSK